MITCSECRIGRYRPAKLPYMAYLGRHVLVVPEAPALFCDVCGQREFAPLFLRQLQLLLEDNTRPANESAGYWQRLSTAGAKSPRLRKGT